MQFNGTRSAGHGVIDMIVCLYGFELLLRRCHLAITRLPFLSKLFLMSISGTCLILGLATVFEQGLRFVLCS